RSITVFQNPQALGGLIDSPPCCLQGKLRGPALDVSLVHLKPDLLLISVHSGIHPRFGRLFFSKLCPFAEREDIDADLDSGNPVVPALSTPRLPVILPITEGADTRPEVQASGTLRVRLR